MKILGKQSVAAAVGPGFCPTMKCFRAFRVRVLETSGNTGGEGKTPLILPIRGAGESADSAALMPTVEFASLPRS
jgi:hypothetical protein